MPDPRTRSEGKPLLAERLFGAPGVLLVSGMVLLAFVTFGGLAWLYALLGFAVIAAAALIGGGAPAAQHAGRTAEHPEPEIVGRSIEALIGKLPDPVIVLDRAGRVLAFNAQASAMAPALTRREAVSLALRVPEVVDAIRRAGAGAGAQRGEFSQRGPGDRWLTAHVV